MGQTVTEKPQLRHLAFFFFNSLLRYLVLVFISDLNVFEFLTEQAISESQLGLQDDLIELWDSLAKLRLLFVSSFAQRKFQSFKLCRSLVEKKKQDINLQICRLSIQQRNCNSKIVGSVFPL